MIIFSAWAGMIVFILNNLVSTVDGFITAGYSATSQTVSELGIGPNGWIQNVNFFLTGFLIATFAIGFRQAVAPVVNRKLKKTTVLLVISGIATALAGVFTVDAWTPGVLGTPTSTHGFVHVDLGFVSFLSLGSSILIVGRQLLKVSAWRGYGWYSIVTGSVTFVFFFIFPFLVALEPQFLGVFQRAEIVLASGWLFVMGLRLLRSKSSPSAPLV